MRRDLGDMIKVCQGELKQTNHLRTLMNDLTKGLRFCITTMVADVLTGTTPVHWCRYKVPKALSVSGWVVDFARRLTQLNRIAGLDKLNDVEVWLGGLFFPEAYITATRQAVAHRKRWSLETLSLQLDMEKVNDPEAFIIDGESLYCVHLTLNLLQVWRLKVLHGTWIS